MTDWTPAFPGQRPPFAPGHTLSTTHGAYSPRRVDPLAQELVDGLLADADLVYLAAPVFRPAVWAWARAEAQAQLLTEYLAKRAEEAESDDPTATGVGDLADERVRSAYLLLHRAEARAFSGRKSLGLDPLARARLGKDVAQGRAADATADAATTLTALRRRLEELEARDQHDEQDDEQDEDEGTDDGDA